MVEKDGLGDYDPIAAGEQAEDGTDLLGIRHNLSLGLLGRIERHESAMKSVLWLRSLKRVARPAPDR